MQTATETRASEWLAGLERPEYERAAERSAAIAAAEREREEREQQERREPRFVPRDLD